jgi:leucyl aminopeptidase
MSLSAQFLPLADVSSPWLVVGVFEDGSAGSAFDQLDARLGGALNRLRQSGDLTGKANELTPLYDCQGIAPRRLMLVGLGKRDQVAAPTIIDAVAAAARAITGKPYDRVAVAVPDPVSGLGWEAVAVASGVGLLQGCTGPGLRKNKPERFAPAELWLVAPPGAPGAEVQAGTRRANVEGRAVQLARQLVDTPPCDLYPETFAERARQVAREVGLECTVFDEARLQAENMNSLLGVARGSDRPPRLVLLRYRGGAGNRTLGMVGKGVTFDSGGLSLKSSENMIDMKCDMAGAAAVLGAVRAVAEERLPVNVLGVLALVENMPSGKALKLGDVLRARNGKTIEVLNTDAEGRLILADALSYAVEQKADHLVDLATLTGACMVALGPLVAGLMSNNEAWSERVLRASRHAGEKVWPLPMFPLYAEMIKSNVADMRNIGTTRYAGAISAAKFLEEFVGDVPWAHLDIAGPAWEEHGSTSRDPGGTGFGVRILVELARMYESVASRDR